MEHIDSAPQWNKQTEHHNGTNVYIHCTTMEQIFTAPQWNKQRVHHNGRNRHYTTMEQIYSALQWNSQTRKYILCHKGKGQKRQTACQSDSQDRKLSLWHVVYSTKGPIRTHRYIAPQSNWQVMKYSLHYKKHKKTQDRIHTHYQKG